MGVKLRLVQLPETRYFWGAFSAVAGSADKSASDLSREPTIYHNTSRLYKGDSSGDFLIPSLDKGHACISCNRQNMIGFVFLMSESV